MTQQERDQILLDLIKGQKELFKGQKELFKGQEGLIKGQEETNHELRKLSQSVAKIEVEHGEKIQILLDVVTSHSKKFDSIDKRLESIERKIEIHSDQIYCLNSKVQAF